jgi:hypothetical protein
LEVRDITPAESGNRFTITKEVLLLSEANADAVPVGTVVGNATALASYNTYRFIRTENGLTGWVDLTQL